MASIDVGSYVQWCGGRGRVDLLVNAGTIPGVTGPVPAPPAARVAVWAARDGAWAPTGRKVAVPVGELRPVPPPMPDAHGADRLVTLLAAHDDYVTAAGLPETARPGGAAVKAVYLRGLAAWPGEDKTALRPQEWALGRVQAFLAVAAGAELDGYVRDLDLLPKGHTSSTPRPRPALTRAPAS